MAEIDYAVIASENEGVVEKTRRIQRDHVQIFVISNGTHTNDLVPFASSFFAKRAILSILTRYCVFDVDERLLVMRPYQIVGTEITKFMTSKSGRFAPEGVYADM